jgi:hypothetical protein
MMCLFVLGWVRVSSMPCMPSGVRSLLAVPNPVSSTGAAVCRMRKDPLDPIDNGTKVVLAFRRVTNPKVSTFGSEATLQVDDAQSCPVTLDVNQHLRLVTAARFGWLSRLRSGCTKQAAKAEAESKKKAEQESAAAAKAAPKKAGAWGGLPGR